VSQLLDTYGPEDLSDIARGEIIGLLTDPHYETIEYPEDSDGSTLEIAGGNLYEKGLTGPEVQAALKVGLKSGLNCRIIRAKDGNLMCQLLALSNTTNLPKPVRHALRAIIHELNLAAPFASTDHQKAQFQYLLSYFQTGNVEDFRQYNIEWVKDGSNSPVDFMMGFVEVYEDYLNQIASWESYVQIVDAKTTELSHALAQHAQDFEAEMPYGKYKKTFPKDYAPPALMVYYFQENASMHSGGYNLPNFDDIRSQGLFKNIIRLPLPGESQDPTRVQSRRESLQEFQLGSKVDELLPLFEQQYKSLVLLHEIIGHGSGTYDQSKYAAGEDPVGALGSLGSALEEQRADLAALTFAEDPILIQVGLYTNADEARKVRNAMYDLYLSDFLVTFSREHTVTEAHARGNWLLVNLLIEAGAVEFSNRQDPTLKWDMSNFALRVKDYELYHKVSNDLLAELQRIKAVRDEAALKKLFEEKAPLTMVNEPWAKAVIDRGKNLLINARSIEQPWQLSQDGQSIEILGKDLTLEGVASYLGQ